MTTPDPPALHVEYVAEAKIDVTVDVVAFFAAMSARDRAEYLAWTDDDGCFWGGDPAEKPLAYINSCIDANAEVNSGMYGREVSDFSEIEMWDTPRLRGGGKWGQAQFDALVSAVPWMVVGTLPDEERAEIESRKPGPRDVPLFDLETAS